MEYHCILKTDTMIRTILFLAFLLVTFSDVLANIDPYKVNIPDNTKVVGTYSADFGTASTLHMVLLKNQETKSFDLLPFFISENNEVREMDIISMEREPSIISHHKKEGLISLISYDAKKKELAVIDISTESGTHTVKVEKEVEVPDNVFRMDDKTYLVYQDGLRRTLDVHAISSIEKREDISFELDREVKKEFKRFTKSSQDEINRNEFVKLGSINDRKVYLSAGRLVYTLDDEKSGLTEAMIFHLDNSGSIEMSKFQNNTLEKIKDYSSYIYDNSLFTTSSNKTGMVFKVFDMDTGNETKTFSLEDAIKKIHTDNTGSIMQDYLKEVSKAKMKSTVTVNTTKENKLLIRVDQVDKTTYYYHHNWWFHHWMWQQQMWHNHQMMVQKQIQNINTMPKFTPNGEYYDTYYDVYGALEKPKAIEFVLDLDFEIIPDANAEPALADIDRDKYLKEFEDQKNLKEITAGFTSTNLRYVYKDKKTKEVFIAFKELDSE